MAATLGLAMRVRGVSDIRMAELTGLSRQVVQQRRTGVSRIRPYDLERFAIALGIPEDVLRLTPSQLHQWFAEHDDTGERFARYAA